MTLNFKQEVMFLPEESGDVGRLGWLYSNSVSNTYPS